jgi:hypothetical protein
MNRPDNLTLFLGLGAAIVGGVVLWRLSQAGAGLVTGNNAITQAATNAAGQPVTAYQGAGVVGTVGAATNAASGGWLATAGQRLGGWLYDVTHPTPDSPASTKESPAAGQGNSQTQASGWDYTGKDQSFGQLSAPDGWWPYPLVSLGPIPQGV